MSLVWAPKLVPVAVAAGFVERAQVAKAFFGPELAAAFEAALLLAACRLNGS